MSYKYADRTIFILGSPRSGTAFISKLLDSHPDTLYRHEPDIALRNYEIPTLWEVAQAENFIAQTQSWLNALAETQCLKTVGPFPIFPKNFRSPVKRATILALIGLLGAGDKIPFVAPKIQSIKIPDFVDLGSGACRRLIISSVSAMGRTGLLARAAPESQFILVLRHPWGQIESLQRMPGTDSEQRLDGLVATLANTEPARRRNMSAEKLVALPLIKQLAWVWLIHNEIAMEQLAEAKHYRVVRLFDVTYNPESAGRELFEFCGLPWDQQTSEFVSWSTQATGKERYYSMKRDPAEATWGWRRRLTQSQIDAISEVVAESVPGRMFNAEPDGPMPPASSHTPAG